VDEDRERAIEAITRSAREARPRSSRTIWIAGLVMGLIGVAAFVVSFFADGDASPNAPTRIHEGGRGFATGLAIGAGIGIAIGFAIARQRAKPDARSSGD